MGRTLRSLSFDAKKNYREKNRKKMKASESAERQFYRQLKKVAQAAGRIVERHADGATVINGTQMMRELKAYAEKIGPWATRQSAKMLETVARSNKRAYQARSKEMTVALRSTVAEEFVGAAAMDLLNEQVALIKSIPIEAGLRAQRIAAENFLQGNRAKPDPSVVKQLTEEMGMTTGVAVNRAKLIARTETARANASFVQARAAAVGASGYIWRTTMDGAERDSHAKMNGVYVDYAKPPRLSDGTVGHAGTFPNCRCYQDPVLPEE